MYNPEMVNLLVYCRICLKRLRPVVSYSPVERRECEDHGTYIVTRVKGSLPRMRFIPFPADEIHAAEFVRRGALLVARKKNGRAYPSYRESFILQCVQTRQIFYSLLDASKYLRIAKNGIALHLNGKQERVGGYTFVKIGIFDASISHKPKREPKRTEFPKMPIRCNETGDEYESVAAAGRALGIHASNISRHLGGHRPSVQGYTFVRVDSQEIQGL